MTRPGGRWQNWARNVTVKPGRVERPLSPDAVQRAVQAAAAQKVRIKAVGAGHSFTSIAAAPAVLIDTQALTGLVALDQPRGLATFRAGTRLHQIPRMLARYALAMENMGDIDRQSIAGAISTATHGTGAGFGTISSQMVGAKLITGSGEVVAIDGQSSPELLPAVRVGLGALGILTEVTLRCVPAYLLHSVERVEPLEEVLDTLDERVAGADHFEFFWFPHTRTAMTKTQERLPESVPRHPLPRVGKWVDESLLSNGVYRAACATGRLVPAIVPPFSRLATRLTGTREYTDRWNRVLVQRRTVRFREMEWALPVEQTADAFRAVRALIEKTGMRISFPVEVRFSAGDDAWLSPAHGRATGYIAVHRYWREDPGDYFDAVQDIMRGFGGRPHWGKLHSLGAEELSELYPRFGDFLALRERWDPDRRFGNRYLERVLGS